MTAEHDAELLRLHERLLAGDRTASSELAKPVYDAVIDRLRWLHHSAGDPHMVPSAVNEVIAKHLREPERFEPGRGTLVGYLAMEARGDVLNELDRRKRLRRHEEPVGDRVELKHSARDHSTSDNPVEEEVLARLDPADASPEKVEAAKEALRELDATDQRLLDMMLSQVRSTVAYAAVLGISHLPLEQQRKLVKRHKDRLHKRLERIRARLT